MLLRTLIKKIGWSKEGSFTKSHKWRLTAEKDVMQEGENKIKTTGFGHCKSTCNHIANQFSRVVWTEVRFQRDPLEYKVTQAVYIYIYIHTYIYTYIYIRIYIYIYVCIYVYIYICIYGIFKMLIAKASRGVEHILKRK
jgi:hypothetical protein